MKIYHEDWDCLEDLKYEFRITDEDLVGVEILFATYNYEDYYGSAFVLFCKDGVLYEVHGSHCSCYGLEDQWEPEETSLEALDKIYSGSEYRYAVKSIIDKFSDKDYK